MNNSKNENGLISRILNPSYLILISLFLILVGCSKNLDEDALPYGAPLNLSVSIAGVKDPDLSKTLKASIGNQVGLALPEKQNTISFSKDDFSMDVISIEENQPTDIFENNTNRIKYAATNANMKNGIRYRVLFYKASTDELYASIEAKAGESTNIAATSGETYKWYAYSYNTTDPIPEVSDLENPSITTPTSTTLLYASGTITPTTTKTPLPITFKHQLTQLKVELSEGIGMRKILSATAKFDNPDYVKTCSFDLLNGTKGALTSANVTDLVFEEVIEGSGDLKILTSEAKYYTADESINTYDVDISSISVQYTSTTTRTLTSSQFPDNGKITFGFNGVSNSKGKILQGSLKLRFLLPYFNILVVSNADDNNAFRLHPNTRPGKFIRDERNFGPNSNYVKTKGLTLSPVDETTLMTRTSTGWNRFKDLMTNPSTYPDILIIANWFNYLNDDCWDLVKKYLDAGGNVFYTHDENNNEAYAPRGIANILGASPSTITMAKVNEEGGTYKFNDTQEAGEDALILNGPFGDLRNEYWGQDRSGSTYVIGLDPSKVVVYTNTSRNRNPPNFANTTTATFFRVKSKAFFFVGDGGYYCNDNSDYIPDNSYGDNTSRYRRFPFRTNQNNFPYSPAFGYGAISGSPDFGIVPNVNGKYNVSNAAHFGNIIAWMLNRAHYHPVNRTANP